MSLQKFKAIKKRRIEISDINQKYLDQSNLEAKILGRGFALDTGKLIITRSRNTQTVEERQGLKIACIEEIAFTKNGYENHLKKIINSLGDTKYREYLEQIN